MDESDDAVNVTSWISFDLSESPYELKANCTTSSCANTGDEYQMVAQVALGTAIIVALGILVALIWNTIKRRAAGPSTSSRRSIDSMERLVQDRLRNRPPPYSTAEADKPPSYEESFNDPCTPPPRSPVSLPPYEQLDWIRPPTGESQLPQASGGPSNQRTVCYENQAFDRSQVDLSLDDIPPSPIPSISMAIDLNRQAHDTNSCDDQSDFMVHL